MYTPDRYKKGGSYAEYQRGDRAAAEYADTER